MAATLEVAPSTKTVEKLTGKSDAEAACEAVRVAKEQGLSLTGPDGLLKQLTKTVIETVVDEELNVHLGYERRDTAAKGTANSRNCTRSKTVLTETAGLGGDRCSAGPGRHVRTEDRRQASAAFVRGR